MRGVSGVRKGVRVRGVENMPGYKGCPGYEGMPLADLISP